MKQQIVIEIGTNSLKTLWAEQLGSEWQITSIRPYPARTGDGLHKTNRIKPEKIQLVVQVIKDALQSDRTKPDADIHIIATESMRKADNADELITAIRQEFNLEVEVLLGQEEARLAYIAGSHCIINQKSTVAVLDIGGGSAELIIGKGQELVWSKSQSLGAVNLTQQFIHHDPALATEMNELKAYLAQSMQEYKNNYQPVTLIGIGGTITNLGMLQELTINEVESEILTRQTIAEQVQLLSRLTVREKEETLGIRHGRADIILAGAVLALEFLDFLSLEELIVCTWGVRHGYLFERCGVVPPGE